MLGKKLKPVIELLSGSLVSAEKFGVVDVSIRPRSTMDGKTRSPRGLKFYDLGGVGLGIVAALDKKGDGPGEDHANQAFGRKSSSRSKPIPVEWSKNSSRFKGSFGGTEMDNPEDYTYGIKLSRRTSLRKPSINSKSPCIFVISPARCGSIAAPPASDFLTSCHLCEKKLHSKDIYMYRGEKAFCSRECRYGHIVMDKHKVNCSSEASKSVDVCINGQILSPGILAI